MKYLLTMISLMLTSNVMAHEDHALEQNLHFAYHVAFWSLCVLVAYKGVVWFKRKRDSKQG